MGLPNIINMRPDSWECVLNGEVVELTPSEAIVLNTLVKAKNKVVTKDQLIMGLWNEARDSAYDHCLYNIMRRLRRKLGKTDIIRSRKCIGYKLEALIEPQEAE